jgi:hypothetical protein
MIRMIAAETVLTAASALVVSIISPVSGWVALGVLLLAWPGATYSMVYLGSRNPSLEPEPPEWSWTSLLPRFLFITPVAGLIWYFAGIPPGSAFAYALLGVSAIGAINGVIMEAEDNAPGGWLNPQEKDK